MKTIRHTPRRARQAGFTLVEMLVAVTIGLVVLFGMTATFVNLKNTFRSQDKLGQLQDNERLALTFLTNSVNEAGYFPDPKNASPINAPAAAAPATVPVSPGGTMPVGAGIYGTADGGAATSTESLQTAYAAMNTDGLLSCLGTSYAGAGTVTVRNIYYVDPTTNSLMCRVLVNGAGTDTMTNSGTPQVLVSGIKTMQVVYGLAPGGGTQITNYVGPGSVTAWDTVKAIRITLNFANPFGGADIVRTHTINLMN